ncbi:MAG: PIN domain-containing protein [Myxococcales bacterium]
MLSAPFRVVLDANVLFPFTLRDTLLRAAAAGLFQLVWSEEILEETRRNLVGLKVISEEQAVQLVAAMKEAFPEAVVSGYQSLVPGMQNDEKDRHVAAAAVKAGAQVIVTNNLRDFQNLPEGIEAQSADRFLLNLYDLAPDGMVGLVVEVVAALSKMAPQFARALSGHAEDLEPPDS